MRKNLISIGQLGSEGCITTFTDKTWKVTKREFVVAKGDKVGTLYLCNGNVFFYCFSFYRRMASQAWEHEREGDADSPVQKFVAKFETD